jgi:hypothetical protein
MLIAWSQAGLLFAMELCEFAMELREMHSPKAPLPQQSQPSRPFLSWPSFWLSSSSFSWLFYSLDQRILTQTRMQPPSLVLLRWPVKEIELGNYTPVLLLHLVSAATLQILNPSAEATAWVGWTSATWAAGSPAPSTYPVFLRFPYPRLQFPAL